MVYVELKVTWYPICYSDRISHTCKSDSEVSLRLPARIFKMPCFSSSALTVQAGESIWKHLRMTKDVPRCQVSKWSFGFKGRTAACRLGGKLSRVLSHRTRDWWGTKVIQKSKSLPSCFTCHQKEQKLCHSNYAAYFSYLLCLVQLILSVSFVGLH